MKIFYAVDGLKEKPLRFLDVIRHNIDGIKLGLEFFTLYGMNGVQEIADTFNLPIFLDLKLHDINTTVVNVIEIVERFPVDYLTVHASCSRETINKSVAAAKKVNLLGVWHLTDLSERDEKDIYADNAWNVFTRCKHFYGAIASGIDCLIIRDTISTDFPVFVPGVVLDKTKSPHQTMKCTPTEAKQAGATAIVVGSCVREAMDPVAALQEIRRQIS